MDNIKRVNNEAPIPEYMLKAQQQQQQQQQQKAKVEAAPQNPQALKPPVPSRAGQHPQQRLSPNPSGKLPSRQDPSPSAYERKPNRPLSGIPESNPLAKPNYHYLNNPSPKGDPREYNDPKIVNISKDQQPAPIDKPNVAGLRSPPDSKARERADLIPDMRKVHSENKGVDRPDKAENNWARNVDSRNNREEKDKDNREVKDSRDSKDSRDNRLVKEANNDVKNLNRDKWKVQENVYLQQGKEGVKKEEKNIFSDPKNIPSDPRNANRGNEVRKVADRDILGGGIGGAVDRDVRKPADRDILGGGLNPPDRWSKRQLSSEPKSKENEYALNRGPMRMSPKIGGYDAQKAKEDEAKSDRAALKAKEDEAKSDRAAQKVLDIKKKHEEDRAKRAREEAEEERRRQKIEEVKLQKEKERKERDEKRREVIDNLKNQKVRLFYFTSLM